MTPEYLPAPDQACPDSIQLARALHSTAPLLRAGLLGLLLLGAPEANAKEVWEKVPAEELARTKCVSEPAAAAEVTEYRVDISDLNLPSERKIEQYWRYKVYDPVKAEKLLQLSQTSVEVDGNNLREVEMSARVHRPDGTVQDYGRDDVHKREVSKEGSSDSLLHRIFAGRGRVVTEHFLALGTVPAGTVVEYHTLVREHSNWFATLRPLQFDSLPVAHLTYTHRPWDNEEVAIHLLYLLNSDRIKLSQDPKTHKYTAEGFNLPSLPDEPNCEPLHDRASTIFECYVAKNYYRVKNTGDMGKRNYAPTEPWAPIASIENWKMQDHVEQTDKVKAKAEELTRGATDELGKARRIHAFVLDLHQRFLRAPLDKSIRYPGSSRCVPMDAVLDSAAKHPEWLDWEDFLWLDLSLCRAAGLRAEVVMLPNRSMVHFTPKLPAPALLPNRAVAVRVGEGWHFSDAFEGLPLAFDELPWQCEGYGGLLALDGKQEMVEVPPAPATVNLTRYGGRFQIDAEGTLTGDGMVSFQGQPAQEQRGKLQDHAHAEQLSELQKQLAGLFEGAEVEVKEFRNLDTAAAPLEVDFHLTWPGFAVRADDRLIFRTFLFRTMSHSPFTAATRRQLVFFPYRRQVVDEYTVALPPGYAPEVKEAPPSHPGPALSHEIMLGIDQYKTLHIRRDFRINGLLFPVKSYPAIKAWFEGVDESDQHNIVLVKASAPAAGATPANGKAP